MSRKTVVGDASAIIGDASRSQSWQPGQLHPNLSWTHYRTLLRVDKPEARAFYEIEAIKNNWSARDLERQINSLLYERLAMSRDKSGLMKLATMCLRLRSADALTPVCGIFRMCTATWWMPGRTTTTRAGCPF
jgi:hypothetical protein